MTLVYVNISKKGGKTPLRTKIFTDTTCDLSPERRAAHDITALPLHVFLGETDYLDGVDVTPQQLFDYALQNKQLPKTAAVGEYDFENAFREALDNGYDELVYTGLSSKLSSTYQNACLARDSLIEKGYDAKRFHLVDSLQLSSGTAHLLLRAADIVENGGTAQQAEDDMRATLPRLSTHFIVDTLQYLHMGGRCSSIAFLAGSMLKLHPQINMIDGAMIAGEKFRGKLDRCIAQYEKKAVFDILDQIEPERIFLTHTLPDEPVEALAEEIRKLGYFKEVLCERAGATIASHCGPGTIGFLTIHKA